MKRPSEITRARSRPIWIPVLALTLGGLHGSRAIALDTALSGATFDASHYQTLWSHSPFAVASAEQSPATSQYQLAGIAKFDNVSYASLIDKGNQEHFLLSTQRPDRGLKLISIQSAHDSSPVRAILQKDGQELCVEMDAPAGGPTVADSLSSQLLPPLAIRIRGQSNIQAVMPPGGSLPLIFQPVDAHLTHLTADQVATIERLRQDFARAIASPGNTGVAASVSQGSAEPGPSPQLQNWETAEQQSNDRLEALLGYDAFSQYQMSVLRLRTP